MFNAKGWARLYESAKKENRLTEYWGEVDEDLKTRNQNEISIRNIFESFVPDGRELVDTWARNRGADFSGQAVMEAGVETGNFARITGQIVYNTVMDAWNRPQYIADRVTTTIPTSFLDGEKIPEIAVLGDDSAAIGEGQQYPFAGVSGHYVETPRPDKYGVIVPVTKEAIIADRTGVLLQRVQTVTDTLRINKEKRTLDYVLGETSSTYLRDGASGADVYVDTPYDNLAASNGLTDWTDIDAALQLFDGMTDPNTGEPISVSADTLICSRSLVATAQYILNATEVRKSTASAVNVSIQPGNVVNNLPETAGLEIVSNQYVAARLTTDTDWFVGQPAKAFAYMEVWPITSVQAPTNSTEEFNRDIVQQYKVSEMGTPAVIEPRFMVKSTA